MGGGAKVEGVEERVSGEKGRGGKELGLAGLG